VGAPVVGTALVAVGGGVAVAAATGEVAIVAADVAVAAGRAVGVEVAGGVRVVGDLQCLLESLKTLFKGWKQHAKPARLEVQHTVRRVLGTPRPRSLLLTCLDVRHEVVADYR
jgi:hypothetical protein